MKFLNRMEKIICNRIRGDDKGVLKDDLLDEFFPNKSRLDKLNLDRVLMRLSKRSNLSGFGGVVFVKDGRIFWRDMQ